MKVLIKPKLEGNFYDAALQLLKTYARPLEETLFAKTLEGNHKDSDREGQYIGAGPRYEQKDSHLRIEHTWLGKVAKVTVDKDLASIVFEEDDGYFEDSARLLAIDFSGFLMKQKIPYEVKYQYIGRLVEDIAALDLL
jgi:hypothetical protein